jgi:hypothetical protein
LLGFNLGIELGQLIVLALAGMLLGGLDRVLAAIRHPAAIPSAHRLRVLAISVPVVIVATQMAVARRPW